MEEHNNQKLYNAMKYGSFDVWIGSIKAALCREGQVSTGGCITGMTLD